MSTDIDRCSLWNTNLLSSRLEPQFLGIELPDLNDGLHVHVRRICQQQCDFPDQLAEMGRGAVLVTHQRKLVLHQRMVN